MQPRIGPASSSRTRNLAGARFHRSDSHAPCRLCPPAKPAAEKALRKWIIEPDAVGPKGIRTPDPLAASHLPSARESRTHRLETYHLLHPYETSSPPSARRCLEHAAPVLGEAEVTDVRPHGERAARKPLDHALEVLKIDARILRPMPAVDSRLRSPLARIPMATGERYHRKRYRWLLVEAPPARPAGCWQTAHHLGRAKDRRLPRPRIARTTKDPGGSPQPTPGSPPRTGSSPRRGPNRSINSTMCSSSSSRWGGPAAYVKLALLAMQTPVKTIRHRGGDRRGMTALRPTSRPPRIRRCRSTLLSSATSSAQPAIGLTGKWVGSAVAGTVDRDRDARRPLPWRPRRATTRATRGCR